MKLILAALFVFLLLPHEASAQANEECVAACECLASRSGGGSGSSGGTAVGVPSDDAPDEEGGDREGGGDDDNGGDDDGDGGNDDDDERDGDDEDQELADAQEREDCMASCARLQDEAPEVATAVAECIGGLESCDEFEDECDAAVQLPSCVTACQKLLDCGAINPCKGDTAVTSDSADAEAAGAPAQAGGSGGAGDGEAPEQRQFHLECDDDGNFDEQEALVECAFACTGESFVNFDENKDIIDCIGSTQCAALRETCDPDGDEASGGAQGEDAEANRDLATGGGDEAAGQAAGPGGNAGGGGGASAGGGRSSDGGLCASAPGRDGGGPLQLIGMVLRR